MHRARVAPCLLLVAALLTWSSAAEARVFVRGQVVPDRAVDITDAIALLNHLFLGTAAPGCRAAADANDDGNLNVSDAVRIVMFLFAGGDPIPAPFPAPGLDPTPDALGCEVFPLDAVEVEPTDLVLTAIGARAQLRVTGRLGVESVDLTSDEVGTTYSASPASVAEVSTTGEITALAAGVATVLVRYDAFTVPVEVRVEIIEPPSGEYRVFAVNDLGMHCIDRETSIYSILPPFNVVTAQVVLQRDDDSPLLLGSDDIEVRYSAIADASGSVNSTSLGKTDFWAHAEQLFGVALPPGQGFFGHYMPADAPDVEAVTFAFDPANDTFVAAGIPITDRDDGGLVNYYPLLRVSAHARSTGAVLASTDVVLPVSSETDCQNCHLTGGMAARGADVAWSEDPDPEIQAKTNVLLLHDHERGTNLVAEAPVLCARCHYSRALDLAAAGPVGEQVGKPEFSLAMHAFHGEVRDETGELAFPPDGNAQDTCYQCHPGRITECYRGAMKTGGLECRSCHGDMLAVGGVFPLEPGGSLDGAADGESRRPWMDLPRCQSCHTGDALSHLSGADLVMSDDGIRLRQAFRVGDASASPILATNERFAENDDRLYRFSAGHGGLACEHCHGSTHAEWPIEDAGSNDNLASIQLQGHSGTIVECSTCHAPGTLPTTTNGPHGLHNVDDMRWIDHRHANEYERNPQGCRACHGADLEGTVLSRAAADRAYDIEDDIQPRFAKGAQIGCTHCHRKPR